MVRGLEEYRRGGVNEEKKEEVGDSIGWFDGRLKDGIRIKNEDLQISCSYYIQSHLNKKDLK